MEFKLQKSNFVAFKVKHILKILFELNIALILYFNYVELSESNFNKYSLTINPKIHIL